MFNNIVLNTLASDRFWGFPRKKHPNACGFAWEIYLVW